MEYFEMNEYIQVLLKDGIGSGMDDLAKIIKMEDNRQIRNVELIASENYPSPAVRAAMACSFTSKYAEGYPGKRYYGGCGPTDVLETYCQQRWQKVFDCEDTYDVNVQPHSGTQANMAAIMATCNPGDTILSMSLNAGGHLSHGSKVSFSGKLYNIIEYGLDTEGYIDLYDFEQQLRKYGDKIKLVIIGASAYSRQIPYIKMCNLVKKHSPEGFNIPVMADIAHVSGLIATKRLESPFGCADIVTMTSQKLARGPRGGIIFTKPEWTKKVNSTLFPGIQGGPLENMIAAKAVCANEMLTGEYEEYICNVQNNAAKMADRFIQLGYHVITNGTDNHMFLVDVYSTTGLTGKEVQDLLDSEGITLNKNMIPNDTLPPSQCSGIRIGTPAMTTRNWCSSTFVDIADTIDKIIKREMAEKKSFKEDNEK